MAFWKKLYIHLQTIFCYAKLVKCTFKKKNKNVKHKLIIGHRFILFSEIFYKKREQKSVFLCRQEWNAVNFYALPILGMPCKLAYA